MQKSALDQAIEAVKRSFQMLSGQGNEQVTAQNRNEPKPIATLQDGRILYSDNTIRANPNQPNLETLRSNVLDQYAFTPQAEKYLRNIPLAIKNGNFLGQYDPNHTVNMNPGAFLLKNPNIPAEVMAHEFMHATDQNINATEDASMPRYNQNSGDSYGFSGQFNNKPNPFSEELASFLKNYQEKGQSLPDQTKDTEGFAQTGARLGNKVLNTPVGQDYSGIFLPISKVRPNYSPIYPVDNSY